MERKWNQGILYIDKKNGPVCRGEASDILFSEEREVVNPCITRHRLTYRNRGERAEIIPVFETVTEGTPDFFMIPCVNYNGNQWGTRREPHDMEWEGKPWITSSDRVGIPGCTVAELGKLCVGLFAGSKHPSSDASASVYVREGMTIQRIYFSHVEYPVTFVRKFDYDPSVIRYLTLEAGEERTFECYTYAFEKSDPHELYGYTAMLDFIHTDGYLDTPDETYSPERVKELNYRFIESVTECKEGKYISNIGFLPNGEHRMGDPESTFIFRKGGNYEIGWCGQNISVAEMYIRRYLESGNEKDLEIGMGILDTWLERQYENGLMSVTMNAPMGEECMDTCNLGWFVWKAMICCELLKKAGQAPEKYERAVRAMCGFFLKNYPEGGFPQILNCQGGIVTLEGCAGAMLLAGFLYAYKYFGDRAYLDRAVSAFDFYYGTYLQNSIAAGGALDTYCVDKESAGPVLRAALLLHEITGDPVYLEKAQKVAYYLMTWCFYHDVAFPEASDCAKMGVRTTGGTSVSAAHHHIDCWGAYYVPDMIRLYRLTGKESFLAHARILWRFTVQYQSDGELVLHGMKRMAGAQNEAIFQNLWCTEADGIMRGTLNDWLIIWVKTFQLDALYAVEEMGEREVL